MTTSTDVGIVIHLSKMPASDRSRILADYPPNVKFLLMWLNTHTGCIVVYHLHYEPSFESPEKIIHLNYKALLTYQLIKHIPSSNVMEYLISLGEDDEYSNSVLAT